MSKKGFTLIELVTAVAVLAIIFALAAVVMAHAADAQRKATANAEIMQKFSAITSQMRSDFQGFIYNAPSSVSSRTGEVSQPVQNEPTYPIASDGIIFFATGDFQAAETDSPYENRKGNTAIVQYGLADLQDVYDTAKQRQDPKRKVLARRKIILSSHPNVTTLFTGLRLDYDFSRFCGESLSEIKARYGPDCFDSNWFDIRPRVHQYPDDYSVFMAEGVDDFKIEYLSNDYEFNEWQQLIASDDEIDYLNPTALKFTFWIADRKGIIQTFDPDIGRLRPGRPFTYIVPIAR